VHVLTLNAGSSSVRMALYDGGAAPSKQARYPLGHEQPQPLLHRFLAQPPAAAGKIDVVAHRVVHGGESLIAPCLIDARVEAEIERLAPLAPLHNPVALAWIRACRELFRCAQVAAFDTALFAGLPAVARHYALPHALAQQYRLRRYGFHGLAHEAMWRRWCALHPELPDGGRVISFQLGSGCSVTAFAGGAARDTTMGFSPLEGLMMATRSGDLDPGILIYLQRHAGLTPEALEEILNRESGLQGVAGERDMQQLLARDDDAARLALDMYCYRARKYLGAYLAALGGADAVLFGGGVGENAPLIRARILEGMDWDGIALDTRANDATTGTEARISRPNSKVDCRVIPVDEAALLADTAVRVVRGKTENGQD
jgi:acetate kinase